MDQNAFRSLLSAPRIGEGSSSRGTLGKHAPKRGGGAGGSWGIKPKEGKVYEKPKEVAPEPEQPVFAPRTHRKLDSKYKDRAEMRRQGVDDEYKGVEKLLEDFEKRKADASGDQLAEIEKQRQYLGGDAEHSVLVKGLDFGLLAARKAELAREKEEDVDDELDELGKGYKDKPAAKPAKPDPSKALTEEGQRLQARFRSIGEKAEPMFKSNNANESDAPKKKKKKRKAMENGEVITNEVSVASSSKLPTPPPQRPKAPEPVIDDDEDIFADAGEYDLSAAVGAGADDGEISDSGSEGEAYGDEGGGHISERSRSRSRSRSRTRSLGDDRSRGRSYERDERSMSYSRSRSRSFDSRERSGRGNGTRYSPHVRDGGGRYRSRSRSYHRYDQRRRDYSPPRQLYSRSRSRDRYSRDAYREDSRDRGRYRSPSPHYRTQSPRRRSYSRSPSPPYSSKRPRRDSPSAPLRRSPPAPQRERTRSLTPPLFTTALPLSPHSPASMAGRSISPTPSDDSDRAGQVLGGKLVPLAGSAMSDVKSFLAGAQTAADAEEKKLRKAQWRMKQGLALQDGVTADMVAEYNKELDRRKEEAAEARESGGGRGGRGGGRGGRGGRGERGGKAEAGETREDKRRAQREYQLIMNKMNKEGGKGGGDGDGAGSGAGDD